MSAGAIGMLVAILTVAASLFYLLFVMFRSITDETKKGASPWRDFGLSLALMILFFTTWIGHGISQWQTYTDQQREHGQAAEIGDFTAEFLQSTLENWQSEFLQLFSFVVLAALLIHKGSAESKDSDEEIQQSLQRIEEKLGTLPPEQHQQQPGRTRL